MKNIHKSFPGVRALKGVDFHLNKGEIHALMGENGAGKSTLIKVLTGVYSKDEGQIFIDGNDKAVSIHSPQEAQKLGISTVYQEITLCPNLSVAENMYIGRSNKIYQNWKKINIFHFQYCVIAGKLFHRRTADGSHCQSSRYGL